LAGDFGIGDDSREGSACGVSRDSDEGKEIVTNSDDGGFWNERNSGFLIGEDVDVLNSGIK
jgi:hypothetical protein